MRRHRRAPRQRGSRRGFTLLETMLTLVIVAVGVAGVFDAYQNFFRANDWSTRTATASLLAGEIREFSRAFPRHDAVTGLVADSGTAVGWGVEAGEVTVDDLDDLDDLDGMRFTFSGDNAASLEFAGPINASGAQIPQYVITATDAASGAEFTFGWQQEVVVEKVNPFDYSEVVADAFETADMDADEFPLRVTVIVSYQDLLDASPVEVTRVSWVVP
ncbi:MAG: prepilin-type N-terminal cleavage/methylation domain-containing protein [Planctomycetota bacterium]